MPGAPGLCFSFLIHRPCSFCRGGQWKPECFTVVIATRPARAPKAPDEVVHANQASTVASPAITPPRAQASCSAAGVFFFGRVRVGGRGLTGVGRGIRSTERVYRVCGDWLLRGCFRSRREFITERAACCLWESRFGLAVRR